VIGGGHAGCEAAASSARMGAATVLVTHKLETVGVMSCNPSIGGIGKGVLVKEVDALDGLMGRVIDKSGIHFRTLNQSKGPAVHGPRAQADRELYRTNMFNELQQQANLSLVESGVDDLVIESLPGKPSSPDEPEFRVSGVILEDGTVIRAKQVVISSGTFLRGQILIGPEIRQIGGRRGDGAAFGLSVTLMEKLNLTLGRLITGTPPRLLRASIDYAHPEVQASLPDDPPSPFSFLNAESGLCPELVQKQIPTHFTFTNAETHRVVSENFDLLPTFKEGARGPRYCPSIENKVRRFPDRKRHMIWLEPEGFDNDLVYPNGLNNGFPPEIQETLIRSIPGLEKAVLTQPGYAVEYDFVDPRQLLPSLRLRNTSGLFLAGQINGTTGYEEAASQGIVAGINAALAAQARPSFTLDRADGYIGVMIDDLITRGATEPYRMFTSRSEYRLSLRPENADRRLTPKGIEVGVVGSEREAKFRERLRDFKRGMEFCRKTEASGYAWNRLGLDKIKPEARKRSVQDLILARSAKEVNLAQALEVVVGENEEGKDESEDFSSSSSSPFNKATRAEAVWCQGLGRSLKDAVSVECVYSLYTEKQMDEVERMRRQKDLQIPEDIDYSKLQWFSGEEIEKLSKERPKTIGDASRIMGITPASLSFLYSHCAKRKKFRDMRAQQS